MTHRIGDIVHYVSHGTPICPDGTQAFPSLCRAAIITAIPNPDTNFGTYADQRSLCILNPTGMFFTEDVNQDPNNRSIRMRLANDMQPDRTQLTAGTWHPIH